jgi:hypothetical protein
VIVLVAETAKAVEETFAYNVTGGIFAPPFWVTAGHSVSFCPTDFFVFVSKNLGLLSAFASPSPPERCGEEVIGTVRGEKVRNHM